MNEIIFLISFSDFSSWVYRNKTGIWCVRWVCILWVRWIYLLVLTGFLFWCLFSTCKIRVSMNRDHFTSSLPIWMVFISFSCLTTLARTSDTVWSRSGKRSHPDLVPNLAKKLSVCHHRAWCPLLAFHVAFIMLRWFPYTPSVLSVFITKRGWILSRAFSTLIKMTTSFFPPSFC